MKISRTRQSITGLAISVAILVTLLCGVVLALAESKMSVGERATPTVYHIATLLPSGQPTHIPTASNDPTVVVIPTSALATKIPAATPALLLTSSSTLQATNCRGLPGWQPYHIQQGDTLYSIATHYGVDVTTLMTANCLGTAGDFAPGVIYVPAATPRPRPNATLAPSLTRDPPITGTQTATDGSCSNPDSRIITPKVGAVLSGHVKILGTAHISNFAFYKIEIRQEGTGQPYANLFTGEQPVAQGVLAEFDTATFPQGEFWLRLVVVDASSNYPERCAILVTLAH